MASSPRLGEKSRFPLNALTPALSLAKRARRLVIRVSLGAVPTLLFACGLAHSGPLPGWSYYRPVTVDNSLHAAPLVGYLVHVTLSAPSFNFAVARTDGADIRFTNQAGAPLPFWTETWDAGAGVASFWVKVDSVAGSGVSTIQLSYGNPAASGVSDGHGTFLFYDGFESKNTPAPLANTPTPDGSGQAMHPDVIDIPGGWHGYSYWMAMTPYPYDIDALENPSIIASNDGLNWEVPPGLTNPIAQPFSGGYYNDTEMLFVNNKLVVYYNETHTSGTTYIRKMESIDGVHWTGPVTVLTLANYEMSPTIIIENGIYKMWYVASPGGCFSATQNVYLRTSTDGDSWSAPQTVTFDNPAITAWHFDVKMDGGKYVMLVACYANGSTCEHCDLYYAESTDGLHWTYSPRPMIARSAGGWDNFEIYRSSFFINNGYMRIWYSASSTNHVWGTAYVEGTLQDFMDAAGTPWDYSQGGVANATTPVRSGAFALEQNGGSTYPQISKDMTGKFACTGWFYDDLDVTPEHAALLRLWDTGAAQQPIGVGLLTDQSSSKYSFHTQNWAYTTTALDRTRGWHRFTVAVAPTTCHLLIDDTNVANLAVLNENAIDRFSIEGDNQGTSWFDDVYVRPYSEPEPVVTVQSEISTTGVDGSRGPVAPGLRLQAFRPNPMAESGAVAFSLSNAAQVSVRIVGVQGETVRMLADGLLAPGPHSLTWDGLDGQGRRAASGVYFVIVRGGGESRSRRIVLLH